MSQITFIAVVGGSGSGKTWLADHLGTLTGTAPQRICQDDFYRDLSHLSEEERDGVNFDDPAAIDWETMGAVLDTLHEGKAAELPVYDFSTHTRSSSTHHIEPSELIIIDGLWLLHHSWLREKFSLSIFVDCPENLRLARRLERDVRERGRSEESVLRQFSEHVAPMHDLFVEPQREWADLVLPSPMSAEQEQQLVQACRKAML